MDFAASNILCSTSSGNWTAIEIHRSGFFKTSLEGANRTPVLLPLVADEKRTPFTQAGQGIYSCWGKIVPTSNKASGQGYHLSQNSTSSWLMRIFRPQYLRDVFSVGQPPDFADDSADCAVVIAWYIEVEFYGLHCLAPARSYISLTHRPYFCTSKIRFRR